MPTKPLDPKVVLDVDGYLKPNIPAIMQRYDSFRRWKDTFQDHEGGYDKFTKGYLRFGFNVDKNGEVVYREWAPNARQANLIGDFSACQYAIDAFRMLTLRRRVEQDITPYDKRRFWCLGDCHPSNIPWSVCDPTRLEAQGTLYPSYTHFPDFMSIPLRSPCASPQANG